MQSRTQASDNLYVRRPQPHNTIPLKENTVKTSTDRVAYRPALHDMTSSNTKPLRSCYWNRDNVLLKSHLGIKCPNISLPIYQGPPLVNWFDWGCIVSDLVTIIVSVLLAISVTPKRSNHSVTSPISHGQVTKVSDQAPHISTKYSADSRNRTPRARVSGQSFWPEFLFMDVSTSRNRSLRHA